MSTSRLLLRCTADQALLTGLAKLRSNRSQVLPVLLAEVATGRQHLDNITGRHLLS